MFEDIRLNALEWEKAKQNFPYTKNLFDAAKSQHLFKRFSKEDSQNLSLENILEGFKTMGSKFVPIVQGRQVIEYVF